MTAELPHVRVAVLLPPATLYAFVVRNARTAAVAGRWSTGIEALTLDPAAVAAPHEALFRLVQREAAAQQRRHRHRAAGGTRCC